MVVGQDHRHRLAGKGFLHQLSDRKVHRVHVALGDPGAPDDLAGGVQAENAHALVLTAPEHGDHIAAGVQGAADPGVLLCLLFLDLPGKLRQHRDQGGGGLGQTGLLHQPLGRCMEHGLQAAELIDQPFGDDLGVLPRNGVEQQHLQRLIILEAVEAFVQKASADALAVAAALFLQFLLPAAHGFTISSP